MGSKTTKLRGKVVELKFGKNGMSLVLADLYSLHTQNGHPLIPRGGDDNAGDVPSRHTFPAHGSFGGSQPSATMGKEYMVLVKAVKLANQDNEIPD